MKHFVILLAIPLLIASCKKENLKKIDGINYPTESQFFDVNNDGTADFELRFTQVSSKDIPISESIVTGRLVELNSTLILPHTSGKTLKLTKGDQIDRPGEFIDLVYYERQIVSREWDGNQWDEYWTVDAVSEETYYLGYLLNSNSENNLGWVQFDINKEDATVTIVESKQTSEDFIVID